MSSSNSRLFRCAAYRNSGVQIHALITMTNSVLRSHKGNSMAHPADPQLQQKRAALADKLADLQTPPDDVVDLVRRADAAVAKINAQSTELQAQIDQIDGQLGARELDRRAAAAKAHDAEIAAKRQALTAEVEAYLTAIADAEAHARGLADAVTRAFHHNAETAKAARVLAPNGKVPMALNPLELANRLAGRLASVMSTIAGHRNRLGPIDWPSSAGLYPPASEWRGDEQRRLAAAIQPLTDHQHGKA